MFVSRSQKEAALADLEGRLAKAPAAIFTDFRGVDVAGITVLRAQLRAEGVHYVVAKRKLIERALPAHEAIKVEIELSKLAGFPVPDWFNTLLAGATGIAFADDPLAAARVLVGFQKEYEVFVIKGGLLGGQFIPREKVRALAYTPPREVLLAKLLGAMNAPAASFVGVLAAVLRQFVGTLAAVADQKRGARASAA